MRLLIVFAVLALGFAPAPFPKPARAPAPPTDLQRMQGAWVVVEHRHRGRLLPDKRGEVAVAGTRWRFDFRGGGGSEWEVTLDPTTTPRKITLGGAHDLRGIYRFDGDLLIVYYAQAPDNKQRPTQFDAEGDFWLLILRRGAR